MRCKGHTLIELLIAMSLSMLVIAALVPVNMLTLRSLSQVRQVEKQISLLSRSVKLIEADLRSTALTACAIDENLIVDALFAKHLNASDQSGFNWISGYSNNKWFPERPRFVNDNNAKTFDALTLVKTDMSDALSIHTLDTTPQRVVFITDCIVSEIARSIDSRLLKRISVSSDLSVYAFQFIQYYIKKKSDGYSLYRQYLSRTGSPINEPLVDNIDQLKIGYGERLTDNTIAFKTAAKVTNWRNIISVYISITIADALNKPVSILVLLNNHAAKL